MIKIWNEIVEEGIAFPQEELLDDITAADFLASQTYAAVAEDDVHTQFFEEDGIQKVEVHFERPTENGFNTARCQ